MTNSQTFRWRPHHSKEVTLRLALGQSHRQIASQLGCPTCRVTQRVTREKLALPLSDQDMVDLATRIELARLIEELLDAEPGSAGQARLRASLKDLKKMCDVLPDDDADRSPKRKLIQDMNDEELDAYLSALVPGLDG